MPASDSEAESLPGRNPSLSHWQAAQPARRHTVALAAEAGGSTQSLESQ